ISFVFAAFAFFGAERLAARAVGTGAAAAAGRAVSPSSNRCSRPRSRSANFDLTDIAMNYLIFCAALAATRESLSNIRAIASFCRILMKMAVGLSSRWTGASLICLIYSAKPIFQQERQLLIIGRPTFSRLSLGANSVSG
ncbi:MAG TPA: hypothetical protein VF492_12720, partial [Verrucomicrobiae bacterium]